MKRILVAYFSQSGVTEQMAQYIAEGVRFTGSQAETRNISALKKNEDLHSYDGLILGSPTFSLNLPDAMEAFLDSLNRSDFEGKLLGAFGAYRHEVGYSPGGLAASMMFDKLQDEFKMEPFELGPLQLKEDLMEQDEGPRACQAYGKAFAEKLG